MKKLFRISAVLLCLLAVFRLSATAFAAGTVTYSENAEAFIFTPGSEYSPTDLFTDSKM